MVISQDRPRRKASGGRYHTTILKKRYQLGRAPTNTKIGENKTTSIRTLGGGNKVRITSANTVSVANPKDKTVKKISLKSVLENPANRHFVRRNILTKGTIIDTELGKARITSRPGQSGSVDAVLV